MEAKRANPLMTFGFACNQGFLLAMFYGGANRSLSAGGLVVERADLLVVLAFMVLSFVVVRAVTPKARAALLCVPVLWCCGLFAAAASAAALVFGGTGASFVMEGAVEGFASGLLLAAWGRAFGERVDRATVRSVFAAEALAAGACLVAAAVPGAGGLLVLDLLPLGSALALSCLAAPGRGADGVPAWAHVGQRSAESGPAAVRRIRVADVFSTREQREQAASLTHKMLAGTVLFGMAAGFMETFASEPGLDAMPSLPATLIVLVLFCLAALQLVSFGGFEQAEGTPARLNSVYRLALFVMMAGFLFVPLFGSFKVTGESIVLAGYLGLTCVLLALFLVMSKLRGLDAALSFSFGFAALYSGEMGGILLGSCLGLNGLPDELASVPAAVAGLAALFAYLFLFTEQDFRDLSVIALQVDRFDAACEAIAKRCALSKREAEILPFALKGRTAERIASELCIAKSTVDTHLRRIYAKAGVHSRQELIDLGEVTMGELSSTSL